MCRDNCTSEGPTRSSVRALESPLGVHVAKVLKGIFGLADAPREWYLRLARELGEDNWIRSSLDLALWLKFNEKLMAE